MSSESKETKVSSSPEGNIELTDEFKQAIDFIRAGYNVLITGPAGTGKSTLSRYITENLLRPKDTAKTAPTGAAAILLGGMTIHSFGGFKIAKTLQEMVANSKASFKSATNWSKTKHLFVDECGMLSGTMLVAMDAVGRYRKKNNDAPFGGVQVILVGDPLQLPPINAPFFFEAGNWDDMRFKHVRLTKVFRQQDDKFCKALGEIRLGTVSPDTDQMFRERVGAKLEPINGIMPTRLAAVKTTVAAENNRELDKLKGEAKTFTASDVGLAEYITHLQQQCPVPTDLVLKVDAQVMLVKNLDLVQGLCNGSRGRVVRFEKKTKEDKYAWPVVKFTNGKERLIEAADWSVTSFGEVLASRTQVPLILAWSLTIHKMQGSTLDFADVSLEEVFGEAQVYVALSRLRTLPGLTLRSWNPGAVKVNATALAFENGTFTTKKTSDQQDLRSMFQNMGPPASKSSVVVPAANFSGNKRKPPSGPSQSQSRIQSMSVAPDEPEDNVPTAKRARAQ